MYTAETGWVCHLVIPPTHSIRLHSFLVYCIEHCHAFVLVFARHHVYTLSLTASVVRRYMLDMRVEGSRRDDVIAMVAEVSPQARLTLKGGGHVSFALPSADLDLPTLFAQV